MSLQDIVIKHNIIRVTPHENLSRALSRLSTSHDAAFLFNDDDKFIGVINPYYCLIKSSYPGNAKVEHCIYHAPKLHIDYSLAKAADQFIQSKVHYLPVFDRSEQFLGIVTARQLLAQFHSLPTFKVKIHELLKTKRNPLATINDTDSLSTAINLFKVTKYSKLVVVGAFNKLKGILSYYDLISYLVAPKTSSARGEKEGNRIAFYQHKVKDFAKSYVLTLTADHTLQEVIHLILEKKIGSVVIVNSKRQPMGIITTKDLMRFFIQKGQGRQVEVVSKNLSNKNRQIFGGFFTHLTQWVAKAPNLAKARLFIKQEKGGKLFHVAVSLIPKKGEPQVIKKEGRNLFFVLSPLRDIIKHLTSKTDFRFKT